LISIFSFPSKHHYVKEYRLVLFMVLKSVAPSPEIIDE
jgi:hypothetical protein